MERKDVERWMEGYVRAWTSNDPDEIGGLFTDSAAYFTAPFREPWMGREAIVQGWIDRKDEPNEWTFRWEVLAMAGDVGFAQGETDYPKEGKKYSNLWVIRLTEDGRCSEFTEWWMEQG
jgi:ketosteroid isomerase-like protein